MNLRYSHLRAHRSQCLDLRRSNRGVFQTLQSWWASCFEAILFPPWLSHWSEPKSPVCELSYLDVFYRLVLFISLPNLYSVCKVCKVCFLWMSVFIIPPLLCCIEPSCFPSLRTLRRAEFHLCGAANTSDRWRLCADRPWCGDINTLLLPFHVLRALFTRNNPHFSFCFILLFNHQTPVVSTASLHEELITVRLLSPPARTWSWMFGEGESGARQWAAETWKWKRRCKWGEVAGHLMRPSFHRQEQEDGGLSSQLQGPSSRLLKLCFTATHNS